LAEGANLINPNEHTGWLYPDDIRMVFRFNLSAWPAIAAGTRYPPTVRITKLIGSPVVFPSSIIFRNVTGAVTRHGKCNRRALFADPLYSRKQEGVRYSPVLKEGG
jgi:hypothetical protein